MGKRGPKRKTAAEKAQAKIERSAPNVRVVERQNRFRHFLGDGALGLDMTCVGRLMIVGAFDYLEASPEEILNALLTYSQGYWGQYAGGPGMSDYQKEVRHATGASGRREAIPPDKCGVWFEKYEDVLRDCGHAIRLAIHTITVDTHWFPDTDADWAARIINSRCKVKAETMRRGGPYFDPHNLAADSDLAMLDLTRCGAMALARGRVKKMAA